MSATQQARLKALRQLEGELPDEAVSPHEQLRFEIAHCGTPISTFAELRDEYAVLDVDDRYSPKVRLCSVATGRTGVMKLKKALFKQQPLEPGSILKLLSWERRPSYRFVDGKPRPNRGITELWITKYQLIS